MASKLGPAVLALFFVACGGATQSDLFGAGGGSSNDSGSGGSDSGSTQQDAGGGSDATTGVDSGGALDGGIIVGDASARDGGTVIDAGPLDPGITCGKDQGQTAYCKVGQQDCCITNQGQGSTQFRCTPVGSLSCLGVAAQCDDTRDCAAQNHVCCGVFDGQRYTKIGCTAPSSCNGQGPNGETLYHICDPFLQPTDCPQGTTCQASQVLTGYYLCR